MSRESAALKARRYLTEGRLLVLRVDGPIIRAACRGDGQVYRLGHDPRHGWRCDCPARTRDCAHLLALRLVCAVAPARSTASKGGWDQ